MRLRLIEALAWLALTAGAHAGDSVQSLEIVTSSGVHRYEV